MIKITVPENVEGPVKVLLDIRLDPSDLGSISIDYPKGSWNSSLLHLKEVEGTVHDHGFVYLRSISECPPLPPSYPTLLAQ